jgi:hypothetical protein
MVFYDKLYISPLIRNPRKIRRDLQRGKGHLSIYVLLLAHGPGGGPQLEIMHCANLQTQYYRTHQAFIVGIAEGRADAIEMVEAITNESFNMTGQWNAAEYLASRTGFVPGTVPVPVVRS